MLQKLKLIQNTKAHIALFTVALIYSCNFIIAKDVLNKEFLQPSAFILLRVISGVIMFWVFHTLLIVKEKIDRKDFGLFALCGLFGIAINQLFFFKGLKLTTEINASIIMTTTPILVLIASAIIIKEQITGKKLLGIAFGLSGALILTLYGKKFAYNNNGLLGDLFIFINAASYGIYLVIVKKLMTRYHPITVIKWIFTIGLLFVIPFGAHELMNVHWNTFPTSIWLAVAYVLICTTFLAYLLNAYALSKVNPSIVGTYIYLQPLLTTILALVLAKDQLTFTKVVAGSLIFIGVYLVSQTKKVKEKYE